MSFMARIGYFNWRYLALLPCKSFPKGRVINPGQNKARAKPPQGGGKLHRWCVLTQPIKCLIDLKDKAMDCSAGVNLHFWFSLPPTAKWKDDERRASWGPHLGQHGSSHQNGATCPAKTSETCRTRTTGQLSTGHGSQANALQVDSVLLIPWPFDSPATSEQSTDESNQLTTLFASEDGSFVGQWYLESRLCYPELLPNFFQLHLNGQTRKRPCHVGCFLPSGLRPLSGTCRGGPALPRRCKPFTLWVLGLERSIKSWKKSAWRSQHQKKKTSDFWSTNQTTKHGSIVYFQQKA